MARDVLREEEASELSKEGKSDKESDLVDQVQEECKEEEWLNIVSKL